MHKTVCRVETVTRSEIGRFTYHNIRKPGDQRTEGMEHIRREDMHKNAVLFGTDQPTRDVKQRIEGVKMARAAKGGEGQDIVAQEIILSAHSDFFEGMSEKHIKIWEQANLKFLKERFPGNLVSAVVHRDERAPHIHAIVVPIVESKRVAGEKVLNATEYLGNRGSELRALKKQGRAHESTLGKLQTEYTNAMQKAGFKLERGAENSEEKHVKVELFRKLEKELNAAKQEIQQLNNSKNALTTQVQQLNNTKKEADNSLVSVVNTLKEGTNAVDVLKKNYARLQGEFKEAESKWQEEIKKLEGLAAQGKETVQAAKEEAEKAQAEAQQAKAEAEQARAETEKTKAEASAYIDWVKAEAKKINIGKLRVEASDLRFKIAAKNPPFTFEHMYGLAEHMGTSGQKTYDVVNEYVLKLPPEKAYEIFAQASTKEELKKWYDDEQAKALEAQRQAEREARKSRSHSRGMRCR